MADVPGNISTKVGFDIASGFNFGTYSGELEQFGDVDYIYVDLVAGQTYNFYGVVNSAGTSGDGYITLYDSIGAKLEENDDGGTGFNSVITYTAIETGRYYIGVRTFGGFAGEYQVAYGIANATERQLSAGSDNYTGVANERILGGAGDDVIAIGAGKDALGDQGNDSITGNANGNFISGGIGNDTIFGNGGFDNIFGDSGHDLIYGGADAETIRGGNGFDQILGQGGSDFLYGGADSDYIEGGAGNDRIDGGEGNDTLVGGSGDDQYYVDSIRDYIDELGGSGADVVRSSVTFSLSSSSVVGNVEDIVLLGTASISATGNAVDNDMFGNSGNNKLNGKAGSDTMTGGAGNDTYYFDATTDRAIEQSGGGTDTVIASVSINLANHVENLSLARGYAVNAYGNSGHNILTGNELANTLVGRQGNDRLYGGAGNDTLYGGTGSDILEGGIGSDTFVFEFAGGSNLGRILDFNVAADTIALDNDLFTRAGALGPLSSGAFHISTTGRAHDASDRIIYDSTDGHLYYDADGTGSGSAIYFADLSSNLSLTAANFDIVN